MNPARIVADHLIQESIHVECAETAVNEPLLAGFLSHVVLNQSDLETALAYILTAKLDNATLPALSLRGTILDVLYNEKCIQNAIRADLQAAVQHDPTAAGCVNLLLYLRGSHSIRAYWVAYSCQERDRHVPTLYLQSWVSEVFAANTHPATRIGRGVMSDHATSVVISETAVTEDDFFMFHEVTLGGSGKEGGSHHPRIGCGVMIGAGARVLGDI